MEKISKILTTVIGAIFTLIFIIVSFVGGFVFPLLGLYGIDNNIKWLVIGSSIFAVFYVISMLQRGQLINFIIQYIITILFVKSYEVFNPYILALIEVPLFDSCYNTITIIMFNKKEKELARMKEVQEYNDNFFEKLKQQNEEYDKSKNMK